MTESAGPDLHLVLDEGPLADGPGRGGRDPRGPRSPRVLETLRVPAGVSYLTPDGQRERLLVDRPCRAGWVIEPLTDGPAPRLLLLTPPGVDAPRVNGTVAPRVCLLRVGDQLLLDEQSWLHVTAFQTPRIGPTANLDPDARCSVCRTPFREQGRVYTCACGGSLHHDDDEVPEDRRLQCATLASECPRCRRPIDLEGGFSHVPDVER